MKPGAAIVLSRSSKPTVDVKLLNTFPQIVPLDGLSLSILDVANLRLALHEPGKLHRHSRWRLVAGTTKPAGPQTVVVFESQRKIDGKVTSGTRVYFTSLVFLANVIGRMIYTH